MHLQKVFFKALQTHTFTINFKFTALSMICIMTTVWFGPKTVAEFIKNIKKANSSADEL